MKKIRLKQLICISFATLFILGVLTEMGNVHEVKKPVVVGIESISKPRAYTSYTPIRINNDTDFTNRFSNRTIWGLDINGKGVGHCIYIGNCSLPFTVKDCYLHNASGYSNKPYFNDTGLYLYRSMNGNISDNNCTGSTNNIQIEYSNNNTLENNTCFFSNSGFGFYLSTSSGNSLITNICLNNLGGGIVLDSSSSNIITNNLGSCLGGGILLLHSYNNLINFNICSKSPSVGAITLSSSNDNTLINNTCSNSGFGIELSTSKNNTIVNNTIINSTYASGSYAGIYIGSSTQDIVKNNKMVMCSIYLDGNNLSYYNTHQITPDNTVNGKSIQYIKNQTSGTVPLGAGEIILVNCSNVNIKNQNLSYGTYGLEVAYSSNCIFNSNNCSMNSKNGVYLYSSSYNIFTDNYFIGNSEYGVYLFISCTCNRIYHNYFKDNGKKQAYDLTGKNFWNDSYPSGGNRWSDWTSPDTKSGPNQNLSGPDGIVDIPFNISGGAGAKDYYPLTTPVVVPETPFLTPLIIISVLLVAVIMVRLRKR